MGRISVSGEGLLQGVADLTRGLESISRRVSRSIDRAVRKLESRVEPTLGALPVDQIAAPPAAINPNTLLAIDGLTVEAELAALDALKTAAQSHRKDDAARQLKALAQDILELNRTVDALNAEGLGLSRDDNRAAARREPVLAAALPGKVVSFTEAARKLAGKKSRRRQA